MTYGQLDNELEEGRREGRILLEETCSIPAGQFPLWQEREIPPELEDRCRSLARRRLEGEPLQYLLGRWEFFGLPFWVGPGVLIPRPETELLVETGLALLRGVDRPLAADLCAGSGCITASLAHSLPACRVTAVEWSRRLLPGGWLAVEIGWDQGEAVSRLFAGGGLE